MTDFMERLRRKALKAKPCPFCGKTPSFRFEIDKSACAGAVSVGHYAVRNGCCKATGLGQTELFFAMKPYPGSFKGMVHRLLRDWNRREASQP